MKSRFCLMFIVFCCSLSFTKSETVCGTTQETFICEEGFSCCMHANETTYCCPSIKEQHVFQQWYFWIGIVVVHFAAAGYIMYKYRHKQAKQKSPLREVTVERSPDTICLIDNRQDMHTFTWNETSAKKKTSNRLPESCSNDRSSCQVRLSF